MSGTLNLAGYHLTFDDEFDLFTSSPDGSTGWDTTIWGLRSLGSQEYLSDSSVGVDPFSLNDGALTITAAPGPNPAGAEYDSGEINTSGDFSQTYGYFEMRAELPQGAGMWPAFWMYPETGYGIRELDIMEAFGAPAPDGEGGTDAYHYNVHDELLSGTQLGAWVPTGVNLTTSYNTYGMMWTPTTITFYFDGQAVASEATPADMNVPMYLIACLAVGGSWPGLATGETGQLNIDYIRAYSSSSAVPAVDLQPISSPDGGGTDLYGATALNYPASGATPTPTPAAPSPNGTMITSASASPIIDQAGNSWTLVELASEGLQVAVNGVIDQTTANVILLETLNGEMVQENSSHIWSAESGPGGLWSEISAPAIRVTPAHGKAETISAASSGTSKADGATFAMTAPGVATVTLGSTADTLKFTTLSAITLTGGSAASVVTADGGTNSFTGGSGSMQIKGGVGADSYIYHAKDGMMTIEDFSLAKGDTLKVDQSLQSAMKEKSDGDGGIILTFGSGNPGIHLVGVTSLTSSQINFG